MIRLTREHLVMKALAALGELAHQNSAGPIRPGMAIRFALAYLYSVSDGIARAVGITLTVEIEERLSDMACSHEERQRRIAHREAMARARANVWKPIANDDQQPPCDLSG